jgi:hypothetical protein
MRRKTLHSRTYIPSSQYKDNGWREPFHTSGAAPPSLYVQCGRAAERASARADEPEKKPVFTGYSSFYWEEYHVRSFRSSMRIASQTSALAARWLRVKALPVRDDVHHAFMTRPRHTSIKKDHEQPVVAGAMRNPTREMHFTLH